VLASVGQIKLMQLYLESFKRHDRFCSQVLATKEDFRDRKHYLNIKNCFEGLLDNEVTPIVNENDVISVDELMFTDNDELAALIASMMDAEKLILFTNVDGIFDKHPKEKDAKIISYVTPDKHVGKCITSETSSFGRGGMKTKVKMAEKLAELGISTHIVNGNTDNVLTDILNGKRCGTTFVSYCSKKPSSFKRWIAHTEGYEKGVVHLNECAEDALRKNIASLLPIGITKIDGNFEKGDILRIHNFNGKDIGCGLAAYNAETAKKYCGQKGKKALIHYDHLFLEK
jgi:glutamate 5-kinase